MAGARTGWVPLGGALVVRGGALSAVNVAITAGAFRGLTLVALVPCLAIPAKLS
ncbi:hypothetical protein ILP97_23120 [Amycolatopsis sp. H6(2020)]|nr:hypothetical protein [Amycolatopsis sp. H6(2020)]